MTKKQDPGVWVFAPNFNEFVSGANNWEVQSCGNTPILNVMSVNASSSTCVATFNTWTGAKLQTGDLSPSFRMDANGFTLTGGH